MAVGAMRRPIPLFDTFLDETEVAAAGEVIKSGWLSHGPRVAEFEQRYSEFVGSKCAVAVNSCTAALHLALVAAGVSEGDEVITTPLTFVATVNSILYRRARPVFADIDPNTFNIDCDRVRAKITAKTRAIVPVHYAGLPADMERINGIAAEYGLVVVEDAAHAIGAQYRGRMVGGLGDYTCFSFYANKNITTGEGGMITLDDEEKAEEIRLLRSHGMTLSAFQRDSDYKWDYDINHMGYNYRMSEIAAAIGIAQLSKLRHIIEIRNRNASILSERLRGLARVGTQYGSSEVQSARYFYPIVTRGISRNALLEFLRNSAIMAAVHYRPVYLFQPHGRMLGLSEGHCPVSEDVFSRLISLPCHQGLDEDDMAYIAEKVIEGTESC
jgi:dTDP-4-amino-4,6-dideoxygalactose transaminase